MSNLNSLRNLTCLWDMDSVVYSTAFAGQRKNPETGEIEVEPLEFTLQVAKLTVQGTLDLFHPEREHRLFLGGKDNFREKIATLQPYKGNRVNMVKPVYYNEVREYLIERWGAEIVDGMEADDKVTMLQWAAKDKSTCIVGNDKDLLCCPGWHYNWKKKSVQYIKLKDANLNFLSQLMQGDRTDNIRGIDGVGPQTAAKIIAKYKGDTQRIKREIEAMYKKQHGDNWRAAMDETANLLFLLRDEGKKWSDYV